MIVREALLDDPRPGDVIVTPATGAYGYAMANNYNGVPRPPVIFCRDGDARVVVRRESFEDLTARDVRSAGGVSAIDADGQPAAGRFKVGLLGHGTVGSAFAALLEERAGEIARFNGRSAGDQRRAHAHARGLRGDPRGRRSAGRGDGRDRAGARVPARGDARRQGRRQRQQAAALPARRGAVRDRARARRAGCASRRRSRARCRSCACSRSRSSATPIERIHGIVNGTTNFILTEMAGGSSYAEALAEAQRSGYAEADPSDDVSGRDAAAKMAILARLAFGTPVHLDDVALRGHRAPARRRPGVRARARPRPEADRHRRAPPRRAVGARAPGVPVRGASARGDLRARSTRSRSSPRRSPRSRCRGPAPAAGRPPARCSATSSA